MLDKYTTDSLIAIYLVNGEQTPEYDNPEYGIVDGIMYITTSQEHVTYGGNFYKAGLMFEDGEGEIVNSNDFLTMFGGYKPYNNYSFTIKNSGLINTLKTHGINFYKSQVKMYLMIDSNTYDAYYGAVGKISPLGNKVTITCEDIALVKEPVGMAPTILGQYSDIVTGRNIALNDVSSTVYPTYRLIWPATTGSPTSTSKDDYNADKAKYETVIKSVEEVNAPYGASWHEYKVWVYSETLANVMANTNYDSVEDKWDYYVSTLAQSNMEVIGEAGETLGFYQILRFEKYTLVADEIIFYTLQDPTELVANKTKIRFAEGGQNIAFSESALNETPNINGYMQQTPLFIEYNGNIQNNSFNNGNPISFGYNTKLKTISSDGKAMALPNIPSTLNAGSNDNVIIDSFGFTSEVEDWSYTGYKTNFSVDELDFSTTSETNNQIAQVKFTANTSTTELTVGFMINLRFPKSCLQDESWQLGYGIHSKTLEAVNPLISKPILTTTQTLVSGVDTAGRIIDMDTYSVSAELNDTYAGSADQRFFGCGLGTQPDIGMASGSRISWVYQNCADQMNIIIDPKEYADDYVRLKLVMLISLNNGTGVENYDYHINIYLNSLFLFKTGQPKFSTAKMFEIEGEKWSNDPKHPTSAQQNYPVTRTEVARYILDIAGYYDVMAYLNTIYLGVFDDNRYIAWNNYDKLDKSCNELIDDVLQGSNFILTGNNLGNRKMIDLKVMSEETPAYIKAFTGAIGESERKGFYDNVVNQFEMEFDSLYKVTALFNKETGVYEIKADTDTNTISDAQAITVLTESAIFNGIEGKVKKLSNPYSNYAAPSNVSSEITRLLAVHGWPVFKFTWTIDLKEHMTTPVYMGDWCRFKDLKFTSNEWVYGLIQGVKINRKTATATLNVISNVLKPSQAVLDEQAGGQVLNEQIGGRVIDE